MPHRWHDPMRKASGRFSQKQPQAICRLLKWVCISRLFQPSAARRTTPRSRWAPVARWRLRYSKSSASPCHKSASRNFVRARPQGSPSVVIVVFKRRHRPQRGARRDQFTPSSFSAAGNARDRTWPFHRAGTVRRHACACSIDWSVTGSLRTLARSPAMTYSALRATTRRTSRPTVDQASS